MNKHTPGPWETANVSDVFTKLGAPNAAGRQAESNDGWYIADCSVSDLTHGEIKANARLIASAPALLEALNVMTSLVRIKYGNLNADVSAEIEKAIAAIKQARGE